MNRLLTNAPSCPEYFADVHQIGFADLVVLNKVDLVGPEHL